MCPCPLTHLCHCSICGSSPVPAIPENLDPARSPEKPPDLPRNPTKTPRIGVNYCRRTPLDKQNTYSILATHPPSRSATIPTANTPPKPRAGKAKDNLYRDTLDDDGIRILARAADRIGLADETQMLRVYVHKAMKKEDNSDLVRLLPILARVEEARLRIDARPDAQPVDNPTLDALQAIVDQLKTLTKAENRI